MKNNFALLIGSWWRLTFYFIAFFAVLFTTQTSYAQCTNIGFENGDFTGWDCSWRDRCTPGSDCEDNTPTDENQGTLQPNGQRHCIMDRTNTTLKDQFIPILSPVAPGGRYSARIGNVTQGGSIAYLRRTFTVNQSNALFIYRYAVVLQEPAGAAGHDGIGAAHFMTNVFVGSTVIPCSKYLAIANTGSNLAGFRKVCSDGRAFGQESNASCPTADLDDIATAAQAAPANGNCPANFNTEIFYRDWTTVAVPLNNYIGQTVTIEFAAADCRPNGHLGYAYVDAECRPYNVTLPSVFCPANGNQRIRGPIGFATYQWTTTDGQIVGAANDSIITINRAGTYRLIMAAFGNPAVPCDPVIQTYTVTESCPLQAVRDSVCQTASGSPQATGVNLTTFNSKMVSGSVTVTSWHTGTPGTAANRIANPQNITVNNGNVYYAFTSAGQTVQLTLKVNPLPVVSFSALAMVCQGDAGIDLRPFVSPVAPTPGVFTGNGVSGHTFTPATTGISSLTYTFTDNKGCAASAVQTIAVRPKPTVDAVTVADQCTGVSTITLNGDSSNAGSIRWSGGTGAFDNASAKSPTYTPSASDKSTGTLTLTLATAGAAPCADVSDQVIIRFIAGPQANAGGPYAICSGNASTVQLQGTVQDAVSGSLWEGGSGTFGPGRNVPTAIYTPTASELAGGSLSLTLRTQGGSTCPDASSQAALTFGKSPKANAGPDQALCAVNVVSQLNGILQDGTTASWAGGNGTFSEARSSLINSYTPTAAEVSSGSVQLILEPAATGCPVIRDTIVLRYTTNPQADAGPDMLVCSNNPAATLAGSITSVPEAIWSGGNGSYNPDNKALNAVYMPTAAEIASGSVTLTLTTISHGTCPAASDDIKITITPVPVADAGADSVHCIGSNTFGLRGSTSNATSWQWSGGSGFYSASPTALEGNYTLSTSEVAAMKATLIITANAPGCLPVTDMVTMMLRKLPTAAAGLDQQVCKGSTATISTETAPAVSYQWQNLLRAVLGNGPDLTINIIKDTSLVLVATAAEGCQQRDTMRVRAIPMPVVAVADTDMCAGEKIMLTITPTNLQEISPYNPIYEWSRGAQVASRASTLEVNATGVYTATVRIGQCIGTDQTAVTVHPLPVLRLTTPVRFCADTEASVMLDAGSAYMSYKWMPGNGSERMFEITAEGEYELTVTDSNNCQANGKILTRQVCPPRLYVADAFSPNKDKSNEEYHVYGTHFTNFQMYIFNRWGEVIFETKDKTKGWDGTYRGQMMPMGVYPWIITYEGDTRDYLGPYKKEGSVTIAK